jgi:DNA-directed RNA polymerase subunit RPC12/RpoP
MKMKCPNCKHEWETKSKLIYVTCPSCQLKTKNKEVTNEKTNKENS